MGLLGLLREALACLNALKLVIQVSVIQFARLDASGVTREFSRGLLKVLVSKLPVLMRVLGDAVKRCLDSFHNLLADQDVFV